MSFGRGSRNSQGCESSMSTKEVFNLFGYRLGSYCTAGKEFNTVSFARLR